jgi:hypothetical protein
LAKPEATTALAKFRPRGMDWTLAH